MQELDFRVDEALCVRCGECAQDCPASVIVLDDLPRLANPQGCIRCQHCLAVCPTGALSILGKNPEDSEPLKGGMTEFRSLAVLVKGRRSVRRYLHRELDPGLVRSLLDTACHAPTGFNSQGVLFTLVPGFEAMEGLRAQVLDALERLKREGGLPEGYMGRVLGWAVKVWRGQGRDAVFRDAPHLLVASAPESVPSAVEDCLAALTTFELLACSAGVGTLWNGMVMTALKLCPELRERLGIPKDHRLGYAMTFGLPDVAYHRTVQRGPARVNVVA